MRIEEVKYLLNLPVTQGKNAYLDSTINGISEDSRACKEGYIFIAEKGSSFDGHRAIPNLYDLGVRAFIITQECNLPGEEAIFFHSSNITETKSILANAFFGYPWKELTLIGITGTNGKTTTAHIIRSILGKHFGDIRSVGIMGTVRYAWGNHEEICPVHTTPSVITILHSLRNMVDAGCKAAVMEVSSHALKLGRVKGIRYDVAVFTNLTQDHLDFHPSFEDYFKSKQMLFNQLKENGFASINLDDPYGRRLHKELGSTRQINYCTKGDGDISLKELISFKEGLHFIINYKSREIELKSSLMGIHNMENILSAASIALGLGIEESGIIEGIKDLNTVEGRFQSIKYNDINIIIDYAHTPDALENVLKAIANINEGKGRIITVFGCGGDRDKDKRHLMGSIAEKYSNLVIITSDNPRTEQPEAIIKDIISGMRANGFEVMVDRRQAIKYATQIAGNGDWILIAGKGHENYQILGKEKKRFDDAEEVRRCFK